VRSYCNNNQWKKDWWAGPSGRAKQVQGSESNPPVPSERKEEEANVVHLYHEYYSAIKKEWKLYHLQEMDEIGDHQVE
jgi:hypothetical protein